MSQQSYTYRIGAAISKRHYISAAFLRQVFLERQLCHKVMLLVVLQEHDEIVFLLPVKHQEVPVDFSFERHITNQ